jgi:hypothetical protein
MSLPAEQGPVPNKAGEFRQDPVDAATGKERNMSTESRFRVWATSEDVLARATESGALAEVEAALRAAYERTATSLGKPMRPASIVERELKGAGWVNARAWAPNEFGLDTRDSFDGWKTFVDPEGQAFGVAVEIEWTWERLFADLLKFWRAAKGGQATIGIEVLYGPDAFEYVVHHQFALYRDLFADLRLVFCALDAPGLEEPDRFVHHRHARLRTHPYRMP